MQVDVADAEAVAAAVERVVDGRGRIDVLVNNAGIVRDNILGMLEDEDIRAVLDTNVGGVFNVTRATVRHMISKRSGRIINLSSVAADKGGRGQANYAASKGAINAFTKAMAVELASRKITVNCVAPGVIETEMSQQVRDLADDQIKARILLRRYGQARTLPRGVVSRLAFRRLHHRRGVARRRRLQDGMNEKDFPCQNRQSARQRSTPCSPRWRKSCPTHWAAISRT